jgi:hypothetical protein
MDSRGITAVHEDIEDKSKIREVDMIEYVGAEWAEWYSMTPLQRWEESAKLLDHYLSLGGSLDPEPDTQGPFYDPNEPRQVPVDGRPGMHIVRRGRV